MIILSYCYTSTLLFMLLRLQCLYTFIPLVSLVVLSVFARRASKPMMGPNVFGYILS